MGSVHMLSDSKGMQLKLKLGCFNRVLRKYTILVDENVHKPSVMMTLNGAKVHNFWIIGELQHLNSLLMSIA